jgi:AcrR family transcriptional regulator
MASAPKKKTGATPAKKKERLSQAEATVRMLTAASELLLQYAPGDVTVMRICQKAGVHTDYVVRYFGSREELLSQAVEAAFLGVFLSTNNPDVPRLTIVLEGNVDVMELAKARVRTIAYLLGCGVSHERFQSSQKMLLESVLSQSNNPKVSDRAKMNLILIGTLVVQSMNAFGEMNNLTDQQKNDMLQYLGYLSQSGEQIQEVLGWNKPVAKPRAKKTK